MLSHWPIRDKLLVGLALLLVIVVTLAWGGIHGLYAYRALVRDINRRSGELPLANAFTQDVHDLRLAVGEMRAAEGLGIVSYQGVPAAGPLMREEFRLKLVHARKMLDEYRYYLEQDLASRWITADGDEAEAVERIEKSLSQLEATSQAQDWMFDRVQIGQLSDELDRLRKLAGELPLGLYTDIQRFAQDARLQYRTLIILSWVTSVTALAMLAVLVRLFYQWIFRPLRVLIKGSRRVAAGEFEYTIRLKTQDEMAGLAEAMNDMTARFRSIRDDLDRQVQERTKQVVRSEQLASVGFLAAGVAHEINNPLASIALCAESLEERMTDMPLPESDDSQIVHKYLQMIQTEAFRCKEITEKLLDFSRIGECRRQDTDLREVIESVVDMLGHLDKYDGRNIDFQPGEPVIAPVNGQEIKQVVLNLVVNALDALAPGGTVKIELKRVAGEALLTIADNGFGMTPDVLEHLFEPFFTRRRGGQGTGLGLSIVYRIVSDHGGVIEATSSGLDLGSQFTVRLPLAQRRQELYHRYQAA